MASIVTLVTGDRVTVTGSPGGRRTFSVRPALRPDGRPVRFDSFTDRDRLHVVPSDAAPYLASGVLDRDLFNLDLLATDVGTAPLGVIVGYGGKPAGTAIASAADALPGAEPTAILTSIGAAAVRLDTADAGAFWRSMRAGPEAGSLAGGVTRVWLDRVVRPELDRSVPQIGAPAAWAAGLDGTGVRVAVLDSGIDLVHPDLAGKVSDSANFTAEESIADGNGHGTHVASTVAGSGAASGGRFRGVAPGAALMIGKVLDSSGNGQLSWVIAAMEWAARSGADVVSLSLGAGPSDGSDPGSQAVNALTAETGALFVVAAGNNQGDASVNSPGAADAALTVGAVDHAEALPDFSNRGPRLGDAAVKPEITAPGVEIAAARAAGTALGSPVDDRYTRVSGTSMATPHVSGSAALLAQQHPDWTAQRLKDVLVSTARPGPHTPFQQGAGRVDVARAIAQHVDATASINFGSITDRQTRELTYRNDGAAPVTLALSLAASGWDGRAAPGGELGLGAGSVEIPAGGQASVTVAADPAVTADRGVYSGVVTATSPDGAVVVHTPVSLYEPSASERLTVRAVDREGGPAADFTTVWLYKIDGAVPNDPFLAATQIASTVGGEAAFSVSQGSHDLYASIGEDELNRHRASVVGMPELRITGDRTVTLDARSARRVLADPPARTETLMAILRIEHELADGSRVGINPFYGLGFQNWEFYLQDPPAVRTGWLETMHQWVLATRVVDARVATRGRDFDLTPSYFPYFSGPALEGTRTLPVASVGEGRAEDFDRAGARGKLALARIPIPAGTPFPVGFAWNTAQEITARAAAAGAAGVLVYVDVPGALGLELHSTPIIQLGLTQADGAALERELRRGSPRVTVTGRRTPTDVYRLRYVREPGEKAPDPDWRRVTTIDTRYHGDLPNLTYHTAWHVFDPRHRGSGMIAIPLWGPARVAEHVDEVGPDVQYSRQTMQAATHDLPQGDPWHDSRDDINSRTPDDEHWFRGPILRGAAEAPPGYWYEHNCSLCLDGDRLVMGLHYLDTDPRHFGLTSYNTGRSDFRLFRGDTEIPVQGAITPSARLPVVPATYRLEAVDRQPVDETIRTLAPRTTTTWTFTATPAPAGTRPQGYGCPLSSARANTCAFQPLLTFRYDLGLDLHNRAPAGRELGFEVVAGAHTQALGIGRVAGLRVSTSTDAGAHWRDALVVSRGNGRFHVVVPHPTRAGDAVWLRMRAWDDRGNRVDQTVERAYTVGS